jgi:hypothetical protein
MTRQLIGTHASRERPTARLRNMILNGPYGYNKGNTVSGTYNVTSQERRQQVSIAFICGVCLGGLITALGLLALG